MKNPNTFYSKQFTSVAEKYSPWPFVCVAIFFLRWFFDSSLKMFETLYSVRDVLYVSAISSTKASCFRESWWVWVWYVLSLGCSVSAKNKTLCQTLHSSKMKFLLIIGLQVIFKICMLWIYIYFKYYRNLYPKAVFCKDIYILWIPQVSV